MLPLIFKNLTEHIVKLMEMVISTFIDTFNWFIITSKPSQIGSNAVNFQ